MLSDIIMLVGYSIVAYLFFKYLKPRHVTILKKIFVMLGFVFILCGLTHGVKILGFYDNFTWPIVMVSITSSIITVILLVSIIPMVPLIMKFPSGSQMTKANYDLRQEVSDLLERNAKLATVDNIKAVTNIECAIKAIRKLSEGQHKEIQEKT